MVFSVSEMRWKSRDFFDLYDVEVEGVNPAQDFLNLVGDPTDAVGENLKRSGKRVAAVFDRACDGDCVGVFLFHVFKVAQMREKSRDFFD